MVCGSICQLRGLAFEVLCLRDVPLPLINIGQRKVQLGARRLELHLILENLRCLRKVSHLRVRLRKLDRRLLAYLVRHLHLAGKRRDVL
jgi:hypothetical protein